MTKKSISELKRERDEHLRMAREKEREAEKLRNNDGCTPIIIVGGITILFGWLIFF
ncbi:MAG: hypothetical protein IKI11_01865 [Neisseriaceae bacterium]|nr:hypothetical protein [Neisseriaceae bacterium]